MFVLMKGNKSKVQKIEHFSCIFDKTFLDPLFLYIILDMLSNKGMECVEENADQLANCSHGLAQLLKNIDENYSIFSKEDCK
jgi:hypothetical protein